MQFIPVNNAMAWLNQTSLVYVLNKAEYMHDSVGFYKWNF